MYGNRERMAAALWFMASPAAGAPVIEPAMRAQLMGGQYFYAGEKGALSGNASVAVVPAVRVSERLRLLPFLSSSYQGTKQAVDLVGAGTLFQEQMQHRAGLRAVIDMPGRGWLLKPSVAYSYELLRETRDEEWGSGLFDTWRLSTGLEAEYFHGEPFSVRAAVDYFYTSFPNYTSLESRAGLDPQGQPLARELAGRRVLDHHGQSGLVAGTLLRRRFALDGTFRLQRTGFPEQHLVDSTGGLGETTREDFLTQAGATLRLPAELNTDLRVLGSLEFNATYNSSNQGSYDARRARYLPRFYNYGELKLGAGAQAHFGDARRPIVWSTGLAWFRRSYPYRPPQDSTGLYGQGRLVQNTWLLSTTLRYPMEPRFSVLANWQYSRAGANQDYQQVYAYNYAVTNYLFGIAYEY